MRKDKDEHENGENEHKKIQKYSRDYDATVWLYGGLILCGLFIVALFVLEVLDVDTPKFFTPEFTHTVGIGLVNLICGMGGYILGNKNRKRQDGDDESDDHGGTGATY